MSVVGKAEKKTQRRIVRLFIDDLKYEDLGDRSEADNKNVEEGRLEHFLCAYQGYEESLARKAIVELVKTAGNTSLSLYDRNRTVYDLLRYGVKVKPEVGTHAETVWLIDWKHPERN